MPVDPDADHTTEMKEASEQLDGDIAGARKKAEALRQRDGLDPGDEVGTGAEDLLPDDPDDRPGA